MSIGFVGFCLPIRVFVFFLTHTSTDARERPTARPTVVQSRLVMRFQPSRSTLSLHLAGVPTKHLFDYHRP
jgi:hypothetical protein